MKNKKTHKKLIFSITALLGLLLLAYAVFGAITTLTVSSPTDDPYYTTDTTPSITATAISSVALANATIYGNFSGTWAANATNSSGIENNVAFTLTTDALAEGFYSWNLEVCDTVPTCNMSWSSNYSLVIDTTDPIAPASSGNYANETWFTVNWIYVNFTSTETNYDDCLILKDGTNYTGTWSGSTCNKNFTGLSDGTHQITSVFVNDSAGNKNSTDFTNLVYYTDTTSPASIVSVSPTSSNNTLTTVNWLYLNITFTEANLDTCLMTYSKVGTATSTAMSEATGNCYKNVTSLSDGVYNVTVTINDTAGNSVTTGALINNVTIDNTGPTVGALTNTNYTGTTDMTFRINSTITETNVINSCWAMVAPASGSVTTVAGNLISTSCYIDFVHGNVGGDGTFNVGVYANDSLGNTATVLNATNWTKTTLYSGWNLIHMDRNATLGTIAAMSTGTITSVSLYSNTYHNYTTYVVGAASNEDQAVVDGDAVYVNVNTTVRLLRFWENDVVSRNVSLTSGWNQVSFFNKTTETLGDVCVKTIDNSTNDMLYSTFVDMSQSAGSRYTTMPCLLSVNSATTVPKGQGIWVNVNGTTTFGISRN